jgi:hypothetical protein
MMNRVVFGALLLLVHCACMHCATTAQLQRWSVARRALAQSVVAAATVVFAANERAVAVPNAADTIKFTVRLPTDATGWVASPDAALYLTARQDVGIFQAQIKNVKPPPVLSKRLPFAKGSEAFPLEVTVSASEDLTPEGQELKAQWTKAGGLPLVISARLDADGVAATRDPQDLVGRAVVKKVDGKWEDGQIDLQGRGVAGKFITSKPKK